MPMDRWCFNALQTFEWLFFISTSSPPPRIIHLILSHGFPASTLDATTNHFSIGCSITYQLMSPTMSEFAYADLTPRNPRIKCERPACGKLLPPGVELYILHDKKDSSNDFGVCPECKTHYERKGAGIVVQKNGRHNFNVVSRTEAGPSRQQSGFIASHLKTPMLFAKYVKMSPERIAAVSMAMFNHWVHTRDIPLANPPGHHLCPRDQEELHHGSGPTSV
ncbi:hypothetical protein B0H13DRAFT_2359388 [Mycena leptocephala]|nr:hypothetical protein B0H13DRAFT_2369257 [Mycena leptocephala]KAJ7852595.1 hypothetical protein B0H13DRAFT_2359388 [Mycena leptocephala]